MDVALALIEHGANVDASNDDGRTPIFFAKNMNIARHLIAKGANVNVREIDGWTPLHLCARWGCK